VTVDQIRGEIAASRLNSEEAEDAETEDDHDHEHEHEGEFVEPSTPPTPDEIRAGFARIAEQLSG
jgi:hypothetical protein